jgi:hypothetical protein
MPQQPWLHMRLSQQSPILKQYSSSQRAYLGLSLGAVRQVGITDQGACVRART